MDLGVLSGHAHLLAASPGDRPHVAVNQIVGLDCLAAGRVDLRNRIRNLEIHRAGARNEALGGLGQLENLAAVGALSLEYRAGIVQAVAEYVQSGLAPGHKLAIEPNKSIAVVKRNERSHFYLLGDSVIAGLSDAALSGICCG